MERNRWNHYEFWTLHGARAERHILGYRSKRRRSDQVGLSLGDGDRGFIRVGIFDTEFRVPADGRDPTIHGDRFRFQQHLGELVRHRRNGDHLRPLYRSQHTGHLHAHGDERGGPDEISHCNHHCRGSGIAHCFAKFGFAADRRDATVFGHGDRFHEYIGHVVGDRWHDHDFGAVHSSRSHRNVYGNGKECCGPNQVGLLHSDGDRGANCIAIHLTKFRIPAGGWDATIHGHRYWDDEHSSDLVRYRRNGYHCRTLHRSEHTGQLHTDGDECGGSDEVGVSHNHCGGAGGSLDQSNFCFAGDGRYAAVHRNRDGLDEHVGDVVGDGGNGDHRRSLYRSQYCRHLHGDREERG
jgi:hypothetical protein